VLAFSSNVGCVAPLYIRVFRGAACPVFRPRESRSSEQCGFQVRVKDALCICSNFRIILLKCCM
jgi:hypothetical protein